MAQEEVSSNGAALRRRPFGSAWLVQAAILFAIVGCDSRTEVATEPSAATVPAPEEPKMPDAPEGQRVVRSEEALRYLEQARVEKAGGRLSEALRLFDLSLSASTEVGMPGLAFVERGEVNQGLGMFPEALEDYTRAIRVNPHRDFRLRRIAIANALGRSDLLAEDLEALDNCCRDDVEVRKIREVLGR